MNLLLLHRIVSSYHDICFSFSTLAHIVGIWLVQLQTEALRAIHPSCNKTLEYQGNITTVFSFSKSLSAESLTIFIDQQKLNLATQHHW